MKIVQIAAEFAPLAKAGGLGEVVVGLSRELTRLGEKVDVILPKYDHIDLRQIHNLKLEVPDFKCLGSGNAMWSGTSEECSVHLLEARHPAGYFHRGRIYGFEDDVVRFIYFCRAALEYLKLKKEPIDVLHLHDWHTSLCAPLIREIFQYEIPVRTIVLTIHNLEYQGKCAPHDLDAIGLHGSSFLSLDKMQDDNPLYPKSINLLKGGIVYSNVVNTVSPTYAKEILTPKMGFNLDRTLKQCKTKLTGILNGIDQTLWNPQTDPYIPAHYSGELPIDEILKAKLSVRRHLAQKYSLDPKGPWLGAVTRLATQKGPELLEAAIQQTLDLGGTFLLLGSAPSREIQTHFEHLKKKYTSNKRVWLHFEYDEALAHQIYAALDFLLVPSHFEPCGLTQLIAMRYGTVPIVRLTGGLKDTVFDWEDDQIPASKRNGFTFSQASAASMHATLVRAFHLFHTSPSVFQTLMQRGMRLNFSWEKPAQEYLKLYKR